jgi:NAD-dependent deacetylase
MSDFDETIRAVRRWIEEAECIVVLTGAGISTDSGIPDFRGPQGVWTRNPEAEKMATLQHYMADPEIRKLAWQAKLAVSQAARQPNAGHRALVELEKRGNLHTLITQNVDGLHQDAGTSPEIVVEIHGTLRAVVCMSCADRGPMEGALERVRAGEEDPSCRRCGGILKLARAEHAANSCDLMIAIGSTLSVYPIAGVVPVAKRSGARVVILNAEPTEMDGMADAVLHGGISEILPRMVATSD